MGKIGDLWVRLGLKKDGFDKGMASVKKTGVDALKGVAGAAGVAFGAMEAFDRIVKSNEANNDKWENTVRAMNNSVNEFFSALTSGDFSLFNEGLDTIIQKARDTADALRQIEDTQTMFGYFGGKNSLEFAKQLNILRDKSATNDQRLAAKTEAERLISEQSDLVKVYRRRSNNAVAQVISQRSDINAEELEKQDVERIMGVILKASFEQEDKAYTDAYQEYSDAIQRIQRRIQVLDNKSYSIGLSSDEIRERSNLNDEYYSLKAQYFYARLYNAIWNKTNGDDLKMISGLYQNADAAARGVEGMRSRLLRYSTALTDLEDVEVPPPSGSLAYLQQQLKEAQDAAATAVGEEAQKQAAATVKAIEAEIQGMTLRIDTLNALEDGTYVEDFLGDIDIPDEEYKFNDKIDLKPTDIDVPELSSGMEDYTKNIYEASNAIGVLGGALSNITGLVDSGAASWVSYGTNVMQALAQAIPQIIALANANSAAALTGAGSSVASIPFVGPMMAVAAIASVAAALVNIPKFAEGGVVGGSSYYGDRILARLNSGELVLNQGQQAALSDMLDRPVQRVEITGKLTASGRDLQYVFDKYNTYRKQ